jgi:hypothetical protein
MLQTFWLGWPQTMMLLIFASQVGRITGLSHHKRNIFKNFPTIWYYKEYKEQENLKEKRNWC